MQSSEPAGPICYRARGQCAATELFPVELRAQFFRYFALVRDAPYAFLLDSASTHEGLGRYAVLGAAPWLVYTARRRPGSTPHHLAELRFEYFDDAERVDATRVDTRVGEPFSALSGLLRELAMPDEVRRAWDWPFIGGAVGYVGYEAGGFIEALPQQAVCDLPLPELCFLGVDELLVYDRCSGACRLALTARGQDEASARQKLAARARAWQGRLEAFRPAPTMVTDHVERVVRADCDAAQYRALVASAREHILAGDVFEVCTTYRLQAAYAGTPFELYERLREVNPAPFACLLQLPVASLVSSSPERFLRLDRQRLAQTRPIKGTRPRGADPRADAALRAELLASEKDRAENLMIVDLARNDLGRVCEVDSIEVPRLLCVEAHPSVFQLVSTVTGKLRAQCDAVDLLVACFPPGSMTGAPKIEAMKIIDGLEAHGRGIYSGCVGYFDFGGGADLSVVIRSFVLHRGQCYFGVGGAVVADSDPEQEYAETRAKAAALMAALSASGEGT